MFSVCHDFFLYSEFNHLIFLPSFREVIDAIIFSKAVKFKIPRDLHLHAPQISQGLGINSGSSGLRRRFLHSLTVLHIMI